MAVKAQPKLDARALRADFPAFEELIHGKPLAFLDSAVTSQKPRQVLDAVRDFYATSYSNVHRGVYTLSDGNTYSPEPIDLTVIDDINSWLGRSQFGDDAELQGTYYEFRMYKGALTAEQLAFSFQAGPDPEFLQ